jgi:ATP-binding cassette subfamily A (ABC1) protein 5
MDILDTRFLVVTRIDLISAPFRCMGTGQHLKNRYGSGYLLELKLKSLGSETSGSASLTDVDSSRSERKENLTTFINSLFTSAHVQESFEDRIIFGIAQDNISSLSETFQALEEGNHNLCFLRFTIFKQIDGILRRALNMPLA